MNVSGVIRGYMSKSMAEEKFLLHVVQTIENQLNEWDSGYEINVLKLVEYEFWIKKNDEYIYDLSLSEEEVSRLQQKSPFSLDTALWDQLQDQGLQLIKGYGNYVDMMMK